jgi:hypothetical protein
MGFGKPVGYSAGAMALAPLWIEIAERAEL